MRRTSEIKITPLNIPNTITKDFQYEDRYAMLTIPNFTNYIKHTRTRYHDSFKYFNNDTIIGKCLEFYGEYTEPELELLFCFCNSETIVYDIGANIGYHATGLAFKAKEVYAFEPNHKNYNLLEANAHDYDNLATINAACSNTNGIAHIQDFVLGEPGNLGELKLVKEGQECHIVKLDDYAKDEKLPMPHVVKIDVEGHEWEVIQGMDNIIKNNLPVIFYEHMHGDHLEDVSKYLVGLGYKEYWMPVRNYNPSNFKKNPLNIFGDGYLLNVLAVPFHIQFQSMIPDKVPGESWVQRIERYQKENAK